MKSKSLYTIILALLLLNSYPVSAQFGPGNENCGQENTLGTIINCTNCTIVTGSASGSLGGNQNLEVQANSCGPISITVRYSFDWIQGSNENWIHGISFNASNFWTSQEVDTPANWVFMPNGLTGCCSNSVYGPGYYYDGSNETTCINSNPCNSDNHGTITTIDGDPSNNYGVDCTDNCPVFDFTLTYCPLNNTNSTITEDFSFATSADGESGGYEEDQNCDVKNDFTITITNLCPTTADFNEIPNNYCNAPGVQLGNVASQYDGGNGPSEEWEGGIVQTSGDPNVIFEYCDNIGNTSISHTVGQDGCYAGPVTKNFQVWTPEITNLQVSPLEGCGEFQPSFSANIKIAGTDDDWQGGGFLEWLVDGVVVPDLTVTPENCGPKTVTFTPRFNTGCDDCNVLGNPVTITAYPNYTTQVLDNVMCGTAYARLIGQDGIEVCDQVEVSCLNNGDIANQSYNFNISNPLCPLSASGSIECACTSCVAVAGNLTLSGSFCPGSTVTPSTTGYNSDPEFTTVLLVVDGDDIISVNPLGSIVIPPTCKDFTLYTYNYETSGGSDPNPTTLSSIDCNTNCCDLSSPISLPVQSDLSVSCPPSISLPACTSLTDISTAFSSWKAGFSTSGGCNPLTNNLGSIPVLPSIGCGEGLSLSFTLQASDICNTTPLTCTSTFEVMAAAPIQMTIPQDITVNCEDVPTAGQGDASTTAGCGMATISFSETIIGSIGPCGYTIVRTWTATDDCGTEVSKNQTITVLPAASPTYINPPQDIKIQCGETIPPGENLSITNGLSGACVLVETVSPTMMTVEESTIYTWSYINPCDNDLIEHTQTITEESETMDLAITSITCNDNSTDADPSDDYYTLVFTVTTTVSSNSLYTVKIGSSSYGPYS